MKLRQANKKDIQSIVNLLNKCRPYVFPHDDYLYWILSNYCHSSCFICDDLDKTIGFVSGLPSLDQTTIFIWQICVHPEYRRKGVASLLLNRLFETSVLNGFNQLQLSITDKNVDSYTMFCRFAENNSLKLELLKQVEIGGIIENVYKIRKMWYGNRMHRIA